MNEKSAHSSVFAALSLLLYVDSERLPVRPVLPVQHLRPPRALRPVAAAPPRPHVGFLRPVAARRPRPSADADRLAKGHSDWRELCASHPVGNCAGEPIRRDAAGKAVM